MSPGTLDRLEVLLEEEAGRALDEAASGAPAEFRLILDRARESAAVRMDICLSSCAAAAWAGADPSEGLPGAVAAHLIDSAVACHLTLPGFSLGLQNEALWSEFGEASAILAGDALFPAAIGYMTSRCGLKSVRLAGMAASLLCAGVLPGFSSELALRERGRTEPGEREGVWRLHAGSLARFASEAGAVLAGADGPAVDRAAAAGLELGRAADLAMISDCPSRRGMTEGEKLEEALSSLENLSASLSDERGAALFIDLAERVRTSLGGGDLFDQG